MKFWRDLIERAVTTYVEVFLGLWIASGFSESTTLDLSALRMASISAIPAALSVIKSGLASLRGNTDSASLVKDV